MAVADEAKLRYLDFLSREDRVRHHRYVEEMKQYDMMRSGDINAIAEAHVCGTPDCTATCRTIRSKTRNTGSSPPSRSPRFRHRRRYGRGGRLQRLRPVHPEPGKLQKRPDDVRRLHTDMMTFFPWAKADMQKAETHSKKPSTNAWTTSTTICMRKSPCPSSAEHVHLNPTYLSELFKRETGTAISQYITDKRMEAAENMLKYSEYSFDEIAQILAYRSQSHFSKVFKKHSGMTPGSTAPSTRRTASGRSDCDHGVYHAGCGEPPVTAPRNSGANREIDVSARAKHARICIWWKHSMMMRATGRMNGGTGNVRAGCG